MVMKAQKWHIKDTPIVLGNTALKAISSGSQKRRLAKLNQD